MLVNAQDVRVVVKHLFKHAQTGFTEIAEARVVIAAFSVVVVRNDRGINADGRENIEAVKALHILTNFVHLVHRHSDFAKRECRSRSKGDNAAIHQLVDDAAGNI